MNKVNKRKLIKWIILIAWMAIIFAFSNQRYSWDATHNIISSAFYSMDNNSNIEFIDTLNFIIRKLGHIIEYFLLSLIFISLLKEYTNKIKTIIISCIIFCFLYACGDEFHQSFVDGRSALFTDVLIDSIGIFIAVLSYVLIYNIKRLKLNIRNI